MLAHTLLMLAALGAQADDEEAAAPARDLITRAAAEFRTGNHDQALKLAGQAIQADPEHPDPHRFRGKLHVALGNSKQAIADFDQSLERKPDLDVYELRGSEHFKLGEIDKSIADFNQTIRLEPRREPHHWKRGISFYYAGKYSEGIKQFEGYQTVDDSDVENAVWRFLCMARRDGFETARVKILKIGEDRRVPMRQVYDLFAGQATAEDVMAAVKAGEPAKAELNHRLFYAHQYLALYYEAAGDAKKSLSHMQESLKHKIGHYMYDVARVHVKLRRPQRETRNE